MSWPWDNLSFHYLVIILSLSFHYLFIILSLSCQYLVNILSLYYLVNIFMASHLLMRFPFRLSKRTNFLNWLILPQNFLTNSKAKLIYALAAPVFLEIMHSILDTDIYYLISWQTRPITKYSEKSPWDWFPHCQSPKMLIYTIDVPLIIVLTVYLRFVFNE